MRLAVRRIACCIVSLAAAFAIAPGSAAQTLPPLKTLVTDQTPLPLSTYFEPAGYSDINQGGDYVFTSADGNALCLRKAGTTAPTRLLQMNDAMPGCSGS